MALRPLEGNAFREPGCHGTTRSLAGARNLGSKYGPLTWASVWVALRVWTLVLRRYIIGIEGFQIRGPRTLRPKYPTRRFSTQNSCYDSLYSSSVHFTVRQIEALSNLYMDTLDPLGHYGPLVLISDKVDPMVP